MRARTYQEAEHHGRRAESWGVWLLRLKGYRILARGYRCKSGEIDIVARRGRMLAMIEVKARSRLSTAADAVSRRQRQRIERAALQFIASHPDTAGFDIRFDVMLIVPRHLPRHLPDIWRPDA